MSPLFIKMLLHFSSSPAPWGEPSQAAAECVSNMVQDGLVIVLKGAHDPWPCQITERGKALVQMLCDTPFPEQRWFDPRTGKAVFT